MAIGRPRAKGLTVADEDREPNVILRDGPSLSVVEVGNPHTAVAGPVRGGEKDSLPVREKAGSVRVEELDPDAGNLDLPYGPRPRRSQRESAVGPAEQARPVGGHRQDVPIVAQ